MSDIMVIGAAIAGPATALQMAQHGHHVTVIEQRPADRLFSAGILGITHGNWVILESHGVNLGSYELDNGFRDYADLESIVSPFRYVTWYGLHNALISASQEYGVHYEYDHNVSPDEMTVMADYVIDATGVAGASRRKLRHRYSGFTIYRGLSTRYMGENFVTYRGEDNAYLTVGDTPDGAFWAIFVRRAEPAHLRTIETSELPDEYRDLPEVFQRIMEATTGPIAKSPMSDWHVPQHLHNNARTLYTIGDVNGAVRPVTTSGANLAVLEGFTVPSLIQADSLSLLGLETDLLNRREYDLRLGRRLEGPEIGGIREDEMYDRHHAVLFPGNMA